MSKVPKIYSKRDLKIAVVAFIIGVGLMYLYHLSAVKENRDNTNLLISNFNETYETQRGITESYETILHKLSFCSVSSDDPSCSFDEMFNLAKDSTDVREDLVNHLNDLNQETQVIMAKF